MTDNIFVFDRNIIRTKRNRAANHLKEHGFLFDWAATQISERLDVIKKDFPLALQIGNRTNKINIPNSKIITFDNASNLNADILGEEEILPFQKNSFDLVVSPLNLHSVNDLPGALSQINHCLKPDGLFIATLFGGETLYELRQIMNDIELSQTGGMHPRIFPFADLPQMGALMQRSNFNLPVIDSEKITVTYDNAFKLMKDLRLMGEGNSIIDRQKKFTSRQFFQDVAVQYADKFNEENGRIKATFEIIFVLGWKHHKSQQKPLRPGSAKNRLSEALATSEEKLPI